MPEGCVRQTSLPRKKELENEAVLTILGEARSCLHSWNNYIEKICIPHNTQSCSSTCK